MKNRIWLTAELVSSLQFSALDCSTVCGEPPGSGQCRAQRCCLTEAPGVMSWRHLQAQVWLTFGRAVDFPRRVAVPPFSEEAHT